MFLILINCWPILDCKVNANPVIGDVVKVYSQLYRQFYRAKVISSEGNNCFCVSYIDYGDTEVVESSDIFELAENIKKKVELN